MGTFQTGITFRKGVLTNGSVLPGQDYISGLIFNNATAIGTLLPNWPSNGIKQCLSVQDAINGGILAPSSTSKYSDETLAVATYLVTNAGAAGDVISIYSQEPINPLSTGTSPNKVLLCTYTVTTADTTATLLAASIAAAINANSANNGGYTATNSTATLLITFRPGLGVFPNSGTPISVSITGTVAGTLTQPTGSGSTVLGVASKLAVYYYHISEYFRMNPNGNLYVFIDTTGASTTTFTSVTTLQAAANGSIRQVGIYNEGRTLVSNIVADANTLNAVCQANDDNKKPLSAILVEDMSAVTDLTTLPNLSLLSDSWVSVNISQDGSAQGFALYKAYGKTISNLGALLGCVSAIPVSACIGQPIPTLNISNGTENQLPAVGNNTLFSNVSINLQTVLDNYRYIYSGNYTGYTGTYFNDSHCAIISNSNYGYIEQNRVEAKIERILYAAYLPLLKSQLQLNADGTLFAPLVFSLESVGQSALTSQMVAAGELSAVNVVVSPTQNVVTSGKLVVTVYEVNNPIARKIEVNINSVTSL